MKSANSSSLDSCQSRPGHNDCGTGSWRMRWGEAQCGSGKFWWKGQDGKVCTEGQVVLCAVCALSCCNSSERQTLEHPSESLLCGVRKLLEGLSTNSYFSSMENRSKGINCLSSLCSLPCLWATFPFLGPGNNSGREMGELQAWKKTGLKWPALGMVLGNMSKALAACKQKPWELK